jgi:hypothetical protein
MKVAEIYQHDKQFFSAISLLPEEFDMLLPFPNLGWL